MFTAIFRVGSYKCELYERKKDQSGAWTGDNLIVEELRTVNLELSRRVDQPGIEHASMLLGTVNQYAWQHFPLGEFKTVAFMASQPGDQRPEGGEVIAKYVVERYETVPYKRRKDPEGSWNPDNMETVEMRNVFLRPVYGNGKPDHENTKFWNATPFGEVKLGLTDQTMWADFPNDQEMYVTFTKH